MEENRYSGKGVHSWFLLRKKGLGYFAFAMHRFSGIVIVFYLYLHLFVLSSLLRGQATYNELVKEVTYGPGNSFLILDVLLAVVIFYHGANGIRLALNEFGFGLNRNRSLFIVLESVGMAILLVFLYYAYMFLAGGAI